MITIYTYSVLLSTCASHTYTLSFTAPLSTIMPLIYLNVYYYNININFNLFEISIFGGGN